MEAEDQLRPPLRTVKLQQEERKVLAGALALASNGAHVVLVNGNDGKPLGVLLSVGDYELLNAAAALLKNRHRLKERLVEMERGHAEGTLTYEEVFGVR